MTVDITQGHIDSGVVGTCTLCAVALALRDATGEEWFVYQNAARRRFAPHVLIALPADVIEFVAAFDAGNRVAPMAFEFDYQPEGV